MLPDDWSQTRLGQHFKSSRVKGRGNLPTLSVTINDGLVRRDSLDRKMETNLADDEHLLVREGDIAYNMMRMWQGASGLAPYDALVSPAYVVLRAHDTVSPQFAAYLFKHPRMIYLFWAYSYGITEDRLRLYFGDFSAIPVRLPPLREQQRIAEILSTWDQAIEKIEALIANARAQKQALTQQFLSGKRRLPGFNKHWTEYRFGKFTRVKSDKVDPSTLDDNMRGIELEHIEAETGRLIGTSQANMQVSLKTHFVPDDVLYGKLRPYLRKFLAPNFSGVCSTEIWVLMADKTLCLPSYLHLLVQSEAFGAATDISSGSKMPRADWNVVKDAIFALPAIKEQQAIIEVLEVAAEEQRNLERQLDHLRSEKSALMQQILTGKRRVKLDRKEAA